MPNTIHLQCSCGKILLEVDGAPITSVECCCASCQDAGERIRHLDGAPDFLTDFGATPYVMYRKDRVRFLTGADQLKSFRLSPDATTRRVISACCHTPAYLEFKGGHWLSLYGALWPDNALPPLQMRTMTSDLPVNVTLPDDVRNAKNQSVDFFARLFGAWVAMGFRNPTMPVYGEIAV